MGDEEKEAFAFRWRGRSYFSFLLQMTKKIKKLEKETAMYRSRWESSNKALLEMAEEVGFCCCCPSHSVASDLLLGSI